MTKIIWRINKHFWSVMLLLTYVSFQLNSLRTPIVVCTEPFAGYIENATNQRTYFDYILPAECVIYQDDSQYIYRVEDGTSWFTPLVARKIEVTIVAKQNGYIALYGPSQSSSLIVQYSTIPLTDSVISIRILEDSR